MKRSILLLTFIACATTFATSVSAATPPRRAVRTVKTPSKFDTRKLIIKSLSARRAKTFTDYGVNISNKSILLPHRNDKLLSFATDATVTCGKTKPIIWKGASSTKPSGIRWMHPLGPSTGQCLIGAKQGGLITVSVLFDGKKIASCSLQEPVPGKGMACERFDGYTK